MSSEFSSALQLTDLDDFLGPSQACILPGAQQTQTQTQIPEAGTGTTAQGTVADKKRTAEAKNKQVDISLADCLACSGCVTTAETVLVTAQSVDEFLTRAPRETALKLEKGKETPENRSGAAGLVVTVAPQAAASLAAELRIESDAVAKVLSETLRKAGFVGPPDPAMADPGDPDAQTRNNISRPVPVLDSNLGRVLALVECAAEFRERLQFAATGKTPETTADGDAHMSSVDSSPTVPIGPLPMLSSACPGFVCYVEKKYGKDINDHISSVRSPQQIMGALVKRNLAGRFGLAAQDVYHVAIMPCFDKKLEASREDFQLKVDGNADPSHEVREVDCVLSSSEVVDLLKRVDADLSLYRTSQSDDAADAGQSRVESGKTLGACGTYRWLTGEDVRSHMKACKAEYLAGVGPKAGAALRKAQQRGSGGAGGYLDFVFRDLHEQNGISAPDAVGFSPARRGNADLRVVTVNLGETISKGVRMERAYGFRNIANVINKMKPARAKNTSTAAPRRHAPTANRVLPDFVEIMACPSGCTNGGGQIRAPSNDASEESGLPPETARQRLQRVEELYYEDAESICRALGLDESASETDLSEAIACVYERLVGGLPMSELARGMLHTQYHDRTSATIGINPLSVKW